ncbi:MAG: flagellar basal body L-ring protein FlgH, partial [Aeromonas salmonicida]
MKTIWMLGLLALGGCTSTLNTAKPDDPEFAPVYGESDPVSVRPTGAIFQPDQVNGIYSDIKAHRVGDIITIELAESTSASKKANTQSGKDN